MNKHTFWTLAQQYDKIEIPIIQRDYAQGRNTKSTNIIRKNFTNYLIDSLCSEKNIELDFVYGATEEIGIAKEKNIVFIPLDGQQRLTTLFLLHWFIAAREGRMSEAKTILSKFSYETRPSAHDFCTRLIDFEYCNNIAEAIKNATWFNDSWNLDQTVDGMLRMLDTFENNEKLSNCKNNLFDILIDTNDLLISFYFVPLEQFGLTEQLYVRMNARGKMLTEFENFKSEFYKIIAYSQNSLDQFKDCIEYKWVNSLWEYRGKDNKGKELYTIDEPFMHYLAYITDILYHQDPSIEKLNNEQIKYNADVQNNNFDIYREVYSKQENLDFLIFALNQIEVLKDLNAKVLWNDNQNSIQQILQHILTNSNVDITAGLVLYATIYFNYNECDTEMLYDYLRVIRNITENTNDKSRREWTRIIKSINNLACDDIYSLLRTDKAIELMEGFSKTQRSEEILKSHIIHYKPEAKNLLCKCEDDEHFRGNILALIKTSYANKVEEVADANLENINSQFFDQNNLQAIYDSYVIISAENFNVIWGNLINSSLYTQYPWGRLIYDTEYKKHNAVMELVWKYKEIGLEKQISANTFAIKLEKEFVKWIVGERTHLEEVRNVKHQLYLYYILSTRVMGWDKNDFFNDKYNFGWLAKEKGYTSIFTHGIANDNYFEVVNPIFQTYAYQFRYNLGINQWNTPRIECVGEGRINDPFTHILNWANEPL